MNDYYHGSLTLASLALHPRLLHRRNIEHGKMYGERKRTNDLYENVEVDYSGRDVTVETFLQVLSGRHSPSTPDSLRLHATKER